MTKFFWKGWTADLCRAEALSLLWLCTCFGCLTRRPFVSANSRRCVVLQKPWCHLHSLASWRSTDYRQFLTVQFLTVFQGVRGKVTEAWIGGSVPEELDAFISILVQELQVVDLPGGGPPECNSESEQSVWLDISITVSSQQIIGKSIWHTLWIISAMMI